MNKTALFSAAVLATATVISHAAEFPLEFKTLTAEEAMSLPGGSGLTGVLQLDRPAGIRKEPKAKSSHPLYGQLTAGSEICLFRLDESKGTGHGYDQLIVDLNRNGDLSDDPVAGRVPESTSKTTTVLMPELVLFGPITAPENKKMGDWHPVYFAQAYLYGTRMISSSPGAYLGQLRLRAGSYLQTRVELNGVNRTVALVDADCNLHLGDASTPTSYRSGTQSMWYFQNGDNILLSGMGTGTGEQWEAAPHSSILCLGTNAYRVGLSADQKSLAVEPWAEPLAEMSVEPRGASVANFQAAREIAPDKWQLMEVFPESGKAKVPPGNYRLYRCTLGARTASGDILTLVGLNRNVEGGTRCEAGATTAFKCGAPLNIKVTAERDTSVVVSSSSSLVSRIAQSLSRAGQPLQESIQASVTGAGGESYSSFMLQRKNNQTQPPNPTYTITAADGTKIESGNMEFG